MKQYLYALAAVVALALFGMLGFVAHADYRNAVAQERQRIKMLTQLMASNASQILERNQERMERIARRPAIRAMDVNRCDPILADFRDMFPEFANLATIDPTGLAPCSGVPQPGGKPVNVAKREWFGRGMTEKRFIVGNPHIGPITGKMVSVLVQPVWSDDRQLLGLLGLPLDLERFNPRIPSASLPEGTRFGFVAADGTLVWRNVDPENLIGKYVGDLPGPRRGLEVGDGEYESVGTDGAIRYANVAPVPLAGWVAFMSVPARSITDKVLAAAVRNAGIGLAGLALVGLLLSFLIRRIEQIEHELLDAREKAEAASRAKSTFLANMSHELRTPMNAIIGMTSLILRRTDEPKLREQLGKIDQASQHLLAVINDILDISKIEAAHMTLEKTDFKLGALLENLTSLVGHKVAEKGLALRFDIPGEIARLSLKGDPLRLSQILLNLTGNAVKFTATGGIAVRIRLAAETEEEVVLRFEVEDSGIGIPVEDQARIFNSFEQVDGSMTRTYGGTGLGLAISKRLAHMMGGDIGVTSQPGSGSTFWFTARLGRATEAIAPEPASAHGSPEEQLKARFAGARVLLAEDEPINQEVSRGLLEDAGLAIDLAEDGVIAVAKAKERQYALILMDMQMPHMNGIDATRAIRQLPNYAHVPILAMTANAFDEDRQTCLAAGMNDHIGKPVEPPVLFETLLKWLDRGSA